MNNEKNYRQLRQISISALLEESNHLKLIFKGIIIISVLIVVLIVWASLINIREIAMTYGEVVPVGRVQIVQHLEGGIVSQVLVNNGDEVRQGQVLVKMNPIEKEAELAQLKSRQIAFVLDKLRLYAFINRETPDFKKWENSLKALNSHESTERIQESVRDEKLQLDTQNKQRADTETVINNIIKQREEKLQELLQQKKVAERNVGLLVKQLDMYKGLEEKGYVANREYIALLRDANQARGDAERLISLLSQTQESIAEGKNRFKEAESKALEEAFKELGTVNDSLLEVSHKIEVDAAQLKRMSVLSPVSGVVKGIRVFAGNVVKPGDELLEVVPSNQELIVEARVNPRDVGFIRVGSPAIVKVLTYDYARYGGIDGKVTEVSASTFLDPENKPYYKAAIKLERQYIGNNSFRKDLKAGMTVQADIVTGEKTLLQYLLKPIRYGTKAAFRER